LVNEKQDDWDEYINDVLQAYRFGVHATTMETPYFLQHGRDARTPAEVTMKKECIDTFTSLEQYERDIVTRVQEAYESTITNTTEAQNRMVQYYDKYAKDYDYSVGQRVYLYVPVVAQGQSKKLSKLWSGPYRILTKKGKLNVTISSIANPKDVQFVHVNRIKPYRGQEKTLEDDEYTIRGILSDRLSNGKKEYLVKWLGYSARHNSWVPESLVTAKDLILKYERKHLSSSNTNTSTGLNDANTTILSQQTSSSTQTTSNGTTEISQPSKPIITRSGRVVKRKNLF
jgi:hypothetical protein